MPGAPPRLQAVILDLDGVLIDSETVALQSLCSLLGEAGVERTVDDLRHLCGQRGDALLTYLSACLRDDERAAALAQASKESVRRSIEAGEVKPFPGAAEAVAALRRDGLRLVIASSSHRERVEGELAGTGIGEQVEAIVTGEEVQRSKPEPEIFLKAARTLDVDPAACAVVEDSLAGVEAGRRAGMWVVAVAQTFAAEALADAHVVVGTFAEVPAALRERRRVAASAR